MVVERGRGKTSVLITRDSDPADPIATGLPIEDLAAALARVQPKNAFVFLDACEVGELSKNERPIDLELLAGSATGTLLCSFAAPGNLAFERLAASTRGGLFTEQVLKQLEHVPSLSVGRIAEELSAVRAAAHMSKPETLVRGDLTIIPMEGLGRSALRPAADRLGGVRRPAITDLIIQYVEDHGCVWLWGESGSGKTSAVQLMEDPSMERIYASIPPAEEARGLSRPSVVSVLCNQFAEGAPSAFPSGRMPIDGLHGLISKLAINDRRYLLIVDHLDRLDETDRMHLSLEVAGLAAPAVLIAQQPPPRGLDVVALRIPSLTDNEISEFVSAYAPGSSSVASASALRVMSAGSPLRLRAILASGFRDGFELIDRLLTSEQLDALHALKLSSGCTDASLYCESMGINSRVFSQLVSIGLVQQVSDVLVCHDSIVQLFRRHQRTDRSVVQHRALLYWSRQMILTSALTPPARAMAQLLDEKAMSPPIMAALIPALKRLHADRSWELLDRVVSALTSDWADVGDPSWVESCLAAAHIFVRSARHGQAAAILTTLRNSVASLSDVQSFQLSILESERLWWYGQFEEAIAVASGVLASTTDVEVASHARLSEGIAQWFFGRWKQADENFLAVLSTPEIDVRTRGWAQIMLASSWGLRGLHLGQVRELFQLGAALLSQVGDDVGVAVAWGNFGEVSLKNGYHEDAIVQLERGIRVAKEVCGPSQIVEMQRSVVEAALRTRGPHSEELSQALEVIYEYYSDDMGPTVKMQLWNTLARVESLRGNWEKAAVYVQDLMGVTPGNAEYHIYTLGNTSLLALANGRLTDAEELLEDAVTLARQARNPLAVAQMRHDFELYAAGSDAVERAAVEQLISVLAGSDVRG